MEKAHLEVITDIARNAGKVALEHQSSLSLDRKADNTFVTTADTAIQDLMVKDLKALFPAYGFRGEENGLQEVADGKPYWLIDPIDGTENYVRNIAFWSISVALIENGAPVFGCVYQPTLRELFIGIKDGGAFLNGHQLHVSDRNTQEALVVSGRSQDNDDMLAESAFTQPAKQAFGRYRRVGAASLELSYLAAGRIDGSAQFGAYTWDYAAGMCIALEAGAQVTTFGGDNWNLEEAHYIASNGIIHTPLREIAQNVIS